MITEVKSVSTAKPNSCFAELIYQVEQHLLQKKSFTVKVPRGGEWIQLDLGHKENLAGIRIVRGNNSGAFIAKFSVEVNDDEASADQIL